MKRLFAGAAVIAALWIAPQAEAAMLTLPEDPKSGRRLEIGVDYEHILRRELEDADATDNDVKNYDAAYARIQYAAHPLLNAYARIGTGQISHKLEDTFLAGIGHRDLTMKSDWGLAWGVGATGGLRLPWDFKLGYDMSYHVLNADMGEVTHANNGPIDPAAAFSRQGSNVSGSLRWREYQAAGWLAHPIELDRSTLIPYIGGKWSYLRLEDDNVAYRVTDAGATQNLTINQISHNVIRFGVVFGLRLVYEQRLVITLEGHEGDDEAVVTSASWRF